MKSGIRLATEQQQTALMAICFKMISSMCVSVCVLCVCLFPKLHHDYWANTGNVIVNQNKTVIISDKRTSRGQVAQVES